MRGSTPRDGGSTRKQRGPGGERVEGLHAVRELLISGRRVKDLLVADDAGHNVLLAEILDLARDAGVPVHRIPRHRFDVEAHTDVPQGVMAKATPLELTDLADLVSAPDPQGRPPFLLALDGITDPHNLGALTRTADGAGVTGLVLPRHRAVRFTAAAMKAAAGAAEHLPIAVVGGLPAAIGEMSRAGLHVIGVDERGTTTLWDCELPNGPVAMVLGSEGTGLGRLVRERCDDVVSIPMRGVLPSLNVSVAGALACFEVARRR
ncbi:MAG TPA: 23S rRNA (guanosine(2251)-2'-O)-methyltransferase RlmB [Acidimicrobiales bacterium]|jgi:23S rRNA (guanosine2251-2'-O)-methyltransferase